MSRALGLADLPTRPKRASAAPLAPIRFEGAQVEAAAVIASALAAQKAPPAPTAPTKPPPRGAVGRALAKPERSVEGEIPYHFTFVGLALLGVQVVFNAILLVQYGQGDLTDDVVTFLFQNLIALAMSMTGLVMYAVFNRGIRVSWTSAILVYLLLYPIAAFFLQALILRADGQRLAVAPVSYFMFFLALAVAEEMFFRAGLVTLVRRVFTWARVHRYVASAVAILAAAVLFAYFHVYVYSTPTKLLTVLVMGVLFGVAVETPVGPNQVHYIDAAIVAHFVVNVVAGYQFVVQNFGGF